MKNLSRMHLRLLSCLLLLCLTFQGFSQSAKTTGRQYMLVGTYTRGKSDGIYVYSFDSRTGKSTQLSSIHTSNPSYLAVSPGQKYVYSVNEDRDSGAVSAFAFKAGRLQKLDSKPSGGDHPCYVTVDKTGKWVFAANYSGGNFSVFPVAADGSLKPSIKTIQHSGSSVNKDRQEKAHVHCTVLSPDNRYLFVCDLGMDRIMTYSFNPAGGKIAAAPHPFTAITPGSGPRHIIFSPSARYAYVIEELTGTLSGFSYSNGVLKELQRISSVPAGFKGFAGSADIHISSDGKFLYASNRGESNTIGVFAINPANGKLTAKAFYPVEGKAPRNFNFDPSGNFLLVANQDTDNIVVFRRNKQTGLLTDTHERINVGNPVCIKWIK
ncbi:MAG: lactonase family protein [Bacteroidetes bacterium]|nr:lactonase family protein [Bacteroidota bacterium]